MLEPTSRSVLDTPHARGMTALCEATTFAQLPRLALRLKVALGDHAIPAAFLGLVERAVAAVDQVFHGFAELKLADPDRHGDARQFLAGGAAGDLAVGKRRADPLGGGRETERSAPGRTAINSSPP